MFHLSEDFQVLPDLSTINCLLKISLSSFLDSLSVSISSGSARVTFLILLPVFSVQDLPNCLPLLVLNHLHEAKPSRNLIPNYKLHRFCLFDYSIQGFPSLVQLVFLHLNIINTGFPTHNLVSFLTLLFLSFRLFWALLILLLACEKILCFYRGHPASYFSWGGFWAFPWFHCLGWRSFARWLTRTSFENLHHLALWLTQLHFVLFGPVALRDSPHRAGHSFDM